MEREFAIGGIVADVGCLRHVEYSFEQIKFHRQLISNLQKTNKSMIHSIRLCVLLLYSS